IGKSNRIPRAESTSSTSDTVYIIFDNDRHIKINHMTDVRNIQPASSHICRYQKANFSRFESINRIYTGVLPFIGVNHTYILWPIFTFDESIALICHLFSFTKDNDTMKDFIILE